MLEKMLKHDEGYRNAVYWDTEGFPTVGIGHLIIRQKTRDMVLINRELSKQVGRTVSDGKITDEEVTKLFERDMEVTRKTMRNYSRLWETYITLDPVRKNALENMVFQMGAAGVNGFPSMLRALKAKDWAGAKRHALDSRWARQTPNRAKRVSDVLLYGDYRGYPFG